MYVFNGEEGKLRGEERGERGGTKGSDPMLLDGYLRVFH